MSCGCESNAEPISVEFLLENKLIYLNRDVEVYGYLALSVGTRIFPSKLQADEGDFMSSVSFLDPTKDGFVTENCTEKIVLIKGFLDFSYNQYNLVDIESVRYENGEVCWMRKE